VRYVPEHAWAVTFMDDHREPSIEQRIAHMRKRLRFRRERGPRRWFESQHGSDELAPLPGAGGGQSAESEGGDWPRTEWLDTLSDPFSRPDK